MRVILLRSVLFVLFSLAISYPQQPEKPSISVTIGPSEPVVPSGNCTSSRAGYLEQTKPSDFEIGRFVSEKLHEGYVVTIYPTTKRGVFTYLTCTNTMASDPPKH